MRTLTAIAAFAALGLATPALAQTTQPQTTAAPPTAAAVPLDHADFGKEDYWLCKPGRQDACATPLDASIVQTNGKATREQFQPAINPEIDCFYIYPTVSNDPFSTSDLIANAEEKSVISRQFARFGAKCRTFAPMYRQITLPQLRAGQPGATVAAPPQRGAPGQANADIDDAFEYYMKNWNNGRGVVIVGHSQGAGQATRLIRSKIEGTPYQKQLVSALIIGSGVSVEKGKDVGGTFKSIPACRKADQIGCVISYGSFRDTVPAPATGQAVGAGNENGPNNTEGLCVNPAALGGGKGNPKSYFAVPAPLNSSLKAPPRWSLTEPLYTEFAVTPGLTTAECVKKNGKTFLEVHVNADPNDKRADDIYADVLAADGTVNAGWGLHNLDMNLMMGNFIDIVGSQAKAYKARKQ